MENYLHEIFNKRKEQINNLVLSVYDKSGTLFEEMKREVFSDFKKRDITNTEMLAEFLLEQVDVLVAKGDNFDFECKHQEAINAYVKAFIFTYIVDARAREAGYLFEIATYLFYKIAKILNTIKEKDRLFYKYFCTVFDGFDAEYGALINSVYFAWHFLSLSGIARVEEVLEKIKDVGFDCSGAIKMGLMMYIRLNLMNHNIPAVTQALEECDYILINDNMYMGSGVNRITEKFLILFVNILIINNRQDFVRKILEKNLLIRDCYEILLLNYHQKNNQ